MVPKWQASTKRTRSELRHRLSPSSAVSNKIIEAMDHTLSSTSKVIADWIRDGIFVDPFFWMGKNSCDDYHNHIKRQIPIALQPPPRPSVIVVPKFTELEEEKEFSDGWETPISVSTPKQKGGLHLCTEQTQQSQPIQYYYQTDSTPSAEGFATCCGGIFPLSTRSSKSEFSATNVSPDSPSVCHEPDKETTMVKAWPVEQAPDSTELGHRKIQYHFGDDEKHTKSSCRRRGKKKSQTYEKHSEQYSPATEDVSSRSERSDVTDMSRATDMLSVHSFLIVSHPPNISVNTSSKQQKQQHSCLHQTSFQQRQQHVTTPLRNSSSQYQDHTSETSHPTTKESNTESHNGLEYILTPTLMQQLQRSLPALKKGDSFWLQYSLVRDGAGLETLLEKVSDRVKHSVLAIETMDGEVFGAFLAHPWKRSHQWHGSGESFVWTTTTKTVGQSRKRQNNVNNKTKRKIQVYKFAFVNTYVQLCQSDRLLIGSGSGDDADDIYQGFGIALDSDLWTGCSNPCRTFSSPSLSHIHADGSSFEIRNVEVWNLTPCLSMVESNEQTVVHRRQRRHSQRRRSVLFADV